MQVHKSSVTHLPKMVFFTKKSILFDFTTERRAEAHNYSDVSQIAREISKQPCFLDLPAFSHLPQFCTPAELSHTHLCVCVCEE